MERASEGDAAKSEEREGRGFLTTEAGQRDPARTGFLKEKAGTPQPRCGSAVEDVRLFLVRRALPNSYSTSPARPPGGDSVRAGTQPRRLTRSS